ncbi:hypothetical protein ABFT23_03670 [Nocardioides sp. C4-1]|uniref:hypothetical protein n=1 Tax=Nocardioides sp. C4-1 TaxID=3151851 RepID=UPI0032633177
MTRVRRLVRLAVATELRVYGGLVRLLGRRPDVPHGAEPLRYVGAVSVLLWAFTVVSAVELVALHLVIPWHAVRVGADVLGVWGVVWCLGFTGCHYVYPHLATDDGLRLRAQRREPALVVPWEAIDAVRTRERSLDSGGAVQVDDRTASIAVGKRTSLDLVLRRPLAVVVGDVTHEVDEVRVYVDDPRDVAARVRLQIAGGAPPRS